MVGVLLGEVVVVEVTAVDVTDGLLPASGLGPELCADGLEPQPVTANSTAAVIRAAPATEGLFIVVA